MTQHLHFFPLRFCNRTQPRSAVFDISEAQSYMEMAFQVICWQSRTRRRSQNSFAQPSVLQSVCPTVLTPMDFHILRGLISFCGILSHSSRPLRTLDLDKARDPEFASTFGTEHEVGNRICSQHPQQSSTQTDVDSGDSADMMKRSVSAPAEIDSDRDHRHPFVKLPNI